MRSAFNLHSDRSDPHTDKRDPFTDKRDLRQMWSEFNFHSNKRDAQLTNETHLLTKETHLLTKETHSLTKETHSLTKETCGGCGVPSTCPPRAEHICTYNHGGRDPTARARLDPRRIGCLVFKRLRGPERERES